MHHNKVLLRCLEAPDLERVLCDLHDGLVNGNYAGDTNVHKIMQVGFYWPRLFKDAHAYTSKCPVCQKCVSRYRKSIASLQHVVVEEIFQKWGWISLVKSFHTHQSNTIIFLLLQTFSHTEQKRFL